MIKILVGIPCFRIADQVRRCISALEKTPTDILAIDNNADRDVKDMLVSFGDRVKILSSPTNEYCNGAWNRILKWGLEGDYDIIALGSSDVELHSGWYEFITKRFETHKDEVWLPCIGEPNNKGVDDVEYCDNVAGFFTFIPRPAAELFYPIPHVLKHWYGDVYMFGKIREKRWKVVVLKGMTAWHEWSSVTAANPESYKMIEQDKLEWQRLHS